MSCQSCQCEAMEEPSSAHVLPKIGFCTYLGKLNHWKNVFFFFFFGYPLLPAACFTEMYDEVSGTLLLRSFEWLSSYFSTASPSWVHAPPVIQCILDYDTGERVCRPSQMFLSCLGSATNPVSYCCHNRVFIYLISLFGDFFFFSGDVSCCTSSNALLVTFWKAKGKKHHCEWTVYR